jgi:hypothetical protein
MFLWWHVNPRATNGGGTWRRRATTVPAVSEGLLCNSWIFRDLFCIFTCWNMYLNYYYFFKKIMLCCKHATMRKLVKSGVCLCCYPFFGSHTKNKKNTYQKIDIQKESKKIIRVRKWCWNAHKMARNWLRRFKNTRIEIWQYIFNWWEPCWQGKFNLRKKSLKSDVYGLN